MNFHISRKSKLSNARIGFLETSHGVIETPCLVPVATQAVVKTLTSEEVAETKSQILISNTFHLHLKPGEKIVQKAGGLHDFMNWKKPLMTDSGGFQVFSLGFGRDLHIGKMIKSDAKDAGQQVILGSRPKHIKIMQDGVYFKSPIDGAELFIGPKESIAIQEKLGADIIFAFDECTPPLADYEYTKNSLLKTHVWAKICLKAKSKVASAKGLGGPKQALYGIVQGGYFRDLRKISSKFISSLDFDGIAIGGFLGKTKKDMHNTLDWTIPLLPENKPIHLLGIGTIEDIFDSVEKGIDTFDCVFPTRIARRGNLFISPKSKGNIKNKFRINIENAKFRADGNPIDKNCDCMTCKNYSRAYLNHLNKSKELTYFRLASLHNVHFILKLMEEIRNSIDDNKFGRLKKEWLDD